MDWLIAWLVKVLVTENDVSFVSILPILYQFIVQLVYTNRHKEAQFAVGNVAQSVWQCGDSWERTAVAVCNGGSMMG